MLRRRDRDSGICVRGHKSTDIAVVCVRSGPAPYRMVRGREPKPLTLVTVPVQRSGVHKASALGTEAPSKVSTVKRPQKGTSTLSRYRVELHGVSCEM